MTALRPDSTAALAEMIGGAEARIGILAAWSSHWGRRPPEAEYTGLDLGALDRVLSLSEGDLTCRVEAGIAHDKLAAQLESAGLEWPLRPLPGQARLSQTYLSGAAFAGSALFPNPRDWILGGTLVSGRGEIVTTGGATVKNSAGYDLARSCFGSMGALAVPAQLQLRLRPRPQERAELAGPALEPEQYLALLAEARRQLDVVEDFQLAHAFTRLTLSGPGDRVEEAVGALEAACPALATRESADGHAGADWSGRRHQVALPADRMAGLLGRARPGRFWAFPLQRLAYTQGPPENLAPGARAVQALPLDDPQPLREGLALLCRGLDPDRRFV